MIQQMTPDTSFAISEGEGDTWRLMRKRRGGWSRRSLPL